VTHETKHFLYLCAARCCPQPVRPPCQPGALAHNLPRRPGTLGRSRSCSSSRARRWWPGGAGGAAAESFEAREGRHGEAGGPTRARGGRQCDRRPGRPAAPRPAPAPPELCLAAHVSTGNVCCPAVCSPRMPRLLTVLSSKPPGLSAAAVMSGAGWRSVYEKHAVNKVREAAWLQRWATPTAAAWLVVGCQNMQVACSSSLPEMDGMCLPQLHAPSSRPCRWHAHVYTQHRLHALSARVVQGGNDHARAGFAGPCTN